MQYNLTIILDGAISYGKFLALQRKMEDDDGGAMSVWPVMTRPMDIIRDGVEMISINIENLDDVRKIAYALEFIDDDEWGQEEIDRAFQNINSNY